MGALTREEAQLRRALREELGEAVSLARQTEELLQRLRRQLQAVS
jgi:hypothetical protein